MNFSWASISKWLWGDKPAAPAPVSPAPAPVPEPQPKEVGTMTYSVAHDHPGTGALIDTRTPAQKEADVHFAEIVAMANPVNWVYLPQAAWRKFAIFNQNGCGACVAFTMAKLLGIMRFLKDGIFIGFSPGDIYRRRINQQTAGMVGDDAFGIAAQGVTLDAVLPSQNLSEAQINALKPQPYANEIAQLFKLQNPKPIVLPNGDIDAVASVIQATGKGVMVWFWFTYDEWTDRPKMIDPTMGLTDPRSLRHSVTAVDGTLTPDGQKALIIEDSWGDQYGLGGQRVIDETWFKARNFYSAYPMNLQQVNVVPISAAPKYVFARPLQYIPWNDAANAPANVALNDAQKGDVVALQTILQSLTDERGNSYFPTNVKASGYYGSLTAKAVYLWQSDHSVAPQADLDALAGKSFGAASIRTMNAELS